LSHHVQAKEESISLSLSHTHSIQRQTEMCGGDTEEARAGIMATSTGAPWGITLKHTHTHTLHMTV